MSEGNGSSFVTPLIMGFMANKWLIILINPLNLNWILHIFLIPKSDHKNQKKKIPSLALGFGCLKEKKIIFLVCSIQSFVQGVSLVELLL